MKDNEQYRRSLSKGEFQRQFFEEILDFFKLLRIKESQATSFVKREPTALLSYSTIPELYSKCVDELQSLVQAFPKLEEELKDEMKDILEDLYVLEINGLQLLDMYIEFSNLKSKILEYKNGGNQDYIELTASKTNIYMNLDMENISEDKMLADSLKNSKKNKQYLADMMKICKDVRERNREFKSSEICSLWSAYTLIKKGITLDFAYVGLGTSGFRDGHHTLIFTTDPGDDHIRITSHSKAMMDGIAAHVEHIDRDKVSLKELVEAYRLPAAINAAKVRLHIGDSVPVTAFIGRPVFENGNESKDMPTENFEMDQLKTVHMSASACSTMFQNGICDCKIAIERMYVKDAVCYMKSVVGNVMRTQGYQTLAAAFNINTPYYDNLYNKSQDQVATMVTDPYEIAQLAIKIAVDGGFDRVTWDGASNKIPSEPIINQLSHEQFTTLVHLAHEQGLQTYFSAGLEARDVERCIYTGVDGLGIGTSLHFIDPETKLIGAFDPKAITATLETRNKAEATRKGKAAILLARLDRLHYEQILNESEEELRNNLFHAICKQDEEKMKIIMSDDRLTSIIEMEESFGNTIIERGKRTLRYLKNNDLKDFHMNLKALEKSVKHGDIETLRLLYKQQKENKTL